ncbi:uncharacterized protein LOC132641356 isoform X2 [Lycium barbarum]|uniref:uncharacterized protein LOC132641356 isoform X2 n=1 Tax=Lycium barbarum TaxID=112863 RepID=UPI00293EB264|nr:uncharacterized protein LOC132641356 isoform X2 [Lycium barbarum]
MHVVKLSLSFVFWALVYDISVYVAFNSVVGSRNFFKINQGLQVSSRTVRAPSLHACYIWMSGSNSGKQLRKYVLLLETVDVWADASKKNGEEKSILRVSEALGHRTWTFLINVLLDSNSAIFKWICILCLRV